MSPTRRTLLRSAGIALGAGSLAGCLGDGQPSGSAAPGTPTPTPESTPADDADEDDGDDGATHDFRNWLPDPRDNPIRDGYGVAFYDLAAIREREDALHENAYERLQQEAQRAIPSKRNVDVADVDATMEVGFSATVAFGSFDPEALGEQMGWDKLESYRGFDIYGDVMVVVVSESAILEVKPGNDGTPIALAKAIIDTQASDDAPTYADGNDYVKALLGKVEGPHALECYPENMAGTSSRGFRKDEMTGGLKAWTFGADTTEFTYGYTYTDAGAAKDSDLQSYIDSNGDRFGPYEGLDVQTEDRLVWAEGTIATGEFDFLAPGGPGEGVHTPN